MDGSEVMRTTRSVVGSVAVRLVLSAIALTMATAGARVSTGPFEMSSDRLPKPDLILVHDYLVSRDEVQLDSAVSSRLERAVKGTPEAEDQLKIAQQVSRALTKTLVDEIRKLGIRAEPAAATTPVVGRTVSIEGQIVSTDEGNKTRRLVIGLGSGASEVRTLTQVYEVTSGDAHRLIEDFYTTTKSSRKPGFGPIAGFGAGLGMAASRAGAAGGVATLFGRQEWITQEQADKLFWDR